MRAIFALIFDISKGLHLIIGFVFFFFLIEKKEIVWDLPNRKWKESIDIEMRTSLEGDIEDGGSCKRNRHNKKSTNWIYVDA